jgi:hypothetical protein
MVSTADWTAAARWPHIAARSAPYAPVATDHRTRADRRFVIAVRVTVGYGRMPAVLAARLRLAAESGQADSEHSAAYRAAPAI